MPFSQLLILVNLGGSQQNVVIALPPASSVDPFDTAPGINAQQKPGIAGIVQTIAKLGFWDSAGANFYGPESILKITPQ